MSGRVTASPPSYSVSSSPSIHPPRSRCSVNPRASRNHPKLFSFGLRKFPKTSFTCNCTGDSGDNESRTILDAFFLGKAVAEALNERIESAVGEFLSTIGRLQAEQQKQVQEFQEEVLEKARQAKEQAAREVMEARGLIPKSSAVEISKLNGIASNTSSSMDSVSSTGTLLQLRPIKSEEDPPDED